MIGTSIFSLNLADNSASQVLSSPLEKWENWLKEIKQFCEGFTAGKHFRSRVKLRSVALIQFSLFSLIEHGAIDFNTSLVIALIDRGNKSLIDLSLAWKIILCYIDHFVLLIFLHLWGIPVQIRTNLCFKYSWALVISYCFTQGFSQCFVLFFQNTIYFHYLHRERVYLKDIG